MQRQIVVQLQSLKFCGSTDADRPIRLRDAPSNQWIGDVPQWENDVRNEPVAYVRGQQPSVEIGLQVGWFAPTDFQVSAWGAPPAASGAAHFTPIQVVGPYRVLLTEKDRRVRFITAGTAAFNVALPDEIGRHAFQLEWYADWSEKGQPRRLFLGRTPLVLCTTWAAMVDDPDQDLQPWAYKDLMEWSCAWAHGATAPKQICDLLMQNLPATGLQYGVPGWDVRSMLLSGGGMCGGWYQLFAQLANCQGVALAQETMMLPAGKKEEWGGLVLTSPGLNQVAPGFSVALEGHYRDSEKYPPPPAITLTADTTSRYYFGQDPDGHCINMLQGKDGTVTIYDPSFQVTADQVKMAVPSPDGQVERFPPDSGFRSKYFDTAVPFLMSQKDTLPPEDPDPLAYGVTVGCPVIPEVTIVWNKVPAPETATARAQLLEKLQRVVDTHVDEPAAAAWRQKIQDLQSPSRASSSALILDALKEAQAVPLKRGAPVPHAMPPAELVQHVLLELLELDGAATPEQSGGGGQPPGTSETLKQVQGDAVSPRLRKLAGRLR